MPKPSAKHLLERDWERYDVEQRYNPTYFDKRAPSPVGSLSGDEEPFPASEHHMSSSPPIKEYNPDHYDDNDGFVAIPPVNTSLSVPKPAIHTVIDLTSSPRSRRAPARAKITHTRSKSHAVSTGTPHGARVPFRETSPPQEDPPEPLVADARVEKPKRSDISRYLPAVPSRLRKTSEREAQLSKCASPKPVEAHLSRTVEHQAHTQRTVEHQARTPRRMERKPHVIKREAHSPREMEHKTHFPRLVEHEAHVPHVSTHKAQIPRQIKRESHTPGAVEHEAHVPRVIPRMMKIESQPNQKVSASGAVSTARACLPPATRVAKPSERDNTGKVFPYARDKKRTLSQAEANVKCVPAKKRNKVAQSKPQSQPVAIVEDQYPSDLRTFMNSIRASAWLHNINHQQRASEKSNRRRRSSRRIAEQRSQPKTPQAPPLKITPVDISTEEEFRAWLRVVLSEALAAYWALSHPGARTYCSAIANEHIRHALRVVAAFMGAGWTVVHRVRSEEGETVFTNDQFELYKAGSESISVSEESVLEKVYEVVGTVWTRFVQGQNKRRLSSASRDSVKREKSGCTERLEFEGKGPLRRSQSVLPAGKGRFGETSSPQARRAPRQRKRHVMRTRSASNRISASSSRSNDGWTDAARSTRRHKRHKRNRVNRQRK